MPTPTQLLVNVINSGTVAPGGSATVAHGLRSGDKPVAPTLIFPDRGTGLRVNPASVNTLTVTFVNDTDTAQSANFRCERGLSNELDAETVTPVVWQGYAGVPSPTVCNVVQYNVDEDNYTQQIDPAGACVVQVNYTGPAGVNIGTVAGLFPVDTVPVGTRFTFICGTSSTSYFTLQSGCADLLGTNKTILGAGSRTYTVGSNSQFLLIDTGSGPFWVETSYIQATTCPS